jgi:hypothetical protein
MTEQFRPELFEDSVLYPSIQNSLIVNKHLYVSVVNLIDYSDIDKMMDINNENVNNEIEIIK